MILVRALSCASVLTSVVVLGCATSSHRDEDDSSFTSRAVNPSGDASNVGTIRATSFVLLDSAGREIATLAPDRATEEPQLTFVAADGKPSMVLAAGKEGPTISIRHPKYGTELRITGASIEVLDENKLALVRLAYAITAGAEATSLSIQTRNGAPFISGTVIKDGPTTLMLCGAEGQGSAVVTIENGVPSLQLRDASGRDVTRLSR